jgi:glycosyltransferase involved in cell wall biosynthesis
MPPIEAIGIVVPAHDEEDRIVACLKSIARAARHRDLGGVPVEVVVVLDDCSDRTGDRADGLAGVLLGAEHRNVGMARRAGMAEAIRRFDGLRPDRVLLATTDADTRVPAGWLAHLTALRRAGADAIAGTVQVDTWDHHPVEVPLLHAARYHIGGGHHYGHRHVHGANMAFTSEAYSRAAGFAPIATAEDHDLWRRLASSGSRLVSTPHAAVLTSGRREARAPEGFAAFLRRLSDAHRKASKP